MTAAVAGGAGVTRAMSVREGPRQGRMPMQLSIVRGSFFSADDIDGAAAMDPTVWSKLPADLIWKVVLLLPAAKHLQLQSVSRKWRQVLTSPNFRSRVAAAAAAREQQQQPVVARVAMSPRHCHCPETRGGRSELSSSRVVDIDLFTFVPSSFWESDDSYSVTAVVGDGALVCISNNNYRHSLRRPNQYCVLNPVTRTCRVLPLVPFKPQAWLAPTPTTLAICGYVRERARDGVPEVQVATYDLAASASNGRWDLLADLVAHESAGGLGPSIFVPLVALCADETYLFRKQRVHVLVSRRGGGKSQVEVAAAVNQPSAAHLGMDAPQDVGHLGVRLVEHGGAIFFAKGSCMTIQMRHATDVVMGAWRLARERLQWEAVAWLDLAELELLTGLVCKGKVVQCDLHSAYVMREVLVCHVWVDWAWLSLGLNLDTGDWELLVDDVFDRYSMGIYFPRLLQLRPDLFL